MSTTHSISVRVANVSNETLAVNPRLELRGMSLLQQQAVTIGRSGSEVSIQCDSAADAEDIMQLLESLSAPKPSIPANK